MRGRGDGGGVRSVAERKAEATDGHAEAARPAAADPSGQAGPAVETGDAPPRIVETPALRLNPRAPTAKVVDAPFCYSCGSKMQPAGSCYVCTACGSTSGCS